VQVGNNMEVKSGGLSGLASATRPEGTSGPEAPSLKASPAAAAYMAFKAITRLTGVNDSTGRTSNLDCQQALYSMGLMHRRTRWRNGFLSQLQDLKREDMILSEMPAVQSYLAESQAFFSPVSNET